MSVIKINSKETSGSSIKGGKYLDQLNHCYLLKTDFTPWSQLPLPERTYFSASQ
jgi:hypothetical protein